LVNLTPDLDERVRNHAWSPDGSRLAFEAGEPGETDVYVVDISGGVPLNLTTSPGWDGDASWSPDGSRLAFSSNRAGTRDIFVMNADGSGQTNLTQTPIRQETDPAWSPDGAWIAFVRDRPYTAGLGYDLYALPVAGGDPWHMVFSEYPLSHLDWHPGFSGVPGGP
jgi:Tol biopolymer transport system component